ncbi:glycosyltransferase [Nocardioides sp. Soil805]|uniref:glycosyltransferase n=1 Tax=Nocardioides sp. Soil805 TaxID=1736416 RepID=UPI0007030F89|nr:glycosyltransferase [Nocardioides sp. Soil805]KRF35381.1 glycosyl transferase family 1 [Nocardioides sp. Soil805]
METRRIALVTETFYPAVDGTTNTLKQLADHLIDAGHEVLVVAPGPGLSTYRRSQVARIRPLDRPGRQVREVLTRFEPDLVHAVSPGTVGRKALKHARRLGVPTLVVQHSPPAETTRDLWQAKVAARADRLLVTADFLADRLHQLDVDPAVWEPGVDTRAFTPELRDRWLHEKWSRARSREGRSVVVGYAGSLHERHGVRRLVEVADLPGVQLVVIGDGPQQAWLRRHLPRARQTGALQTGDLATALASLDVLVHPGEEETCCHTLREAAASGLPVVAPRAGGAPRVVRDLETGLLYDPTTSSGLRRAVESVVGDRHRALLGARGRELSTRTWRDACGELVAEHYAPLLAARVLAGRRRTSVG